MITMVLELTTVRLKVILVDCNEGEVIMKKELISPNPSSFKTYFTDPYFCILYGRAKMLLMNVRAILMNQN